MCLFFFEERRKSKRLKEMTGIFENMGVSHAGLKEGKLKRNRQARTEEGIPTFLVLEPKENIPIAEEHACEQEEKMIRLKIGYVKFKVTFIKCIPWSIAQTNCVML